MSLKSSIRTCRGYLFSPFFLYPILLSSMKFSSLKQKNLNPGFFFYSDMIAFAKSARDWMDADPDNIIAVHCKGGKGRTGTIICTWLITDGLFEQAQVCSTI